ncbi:hypothetical protein CSOJ01_03877 [Colletotrichum sojae]|uniref:Cytochrome P450 n=1 Tax=Colletotrichum sojae TaxID=2175907 RepID=A0A8H6JLE6_9PEZI|nr:hypothetical protein CSOJ01_03877 [Colletotrichum sojae]
MANIYNVLDNARNLFLDRTGAEASVVLQDCIASIIILWAGVLVFSWARGLYRVHFHPLRHFPGPRKVAQSDRWLYDRLVNGHPEEDFEQLHRDYKTKALRIAPNELHINDTSLYKVVYRQSNPFLKHEQFYLGFFATEPTVFTEVDVQKHKERRRMLNPMFSRSGVLQLESLIRDKLKQLEAKIDRRYERQVINVSDAMRLLTTNVIMELSFCDTAGTMDEQPDGFGSRFLDALAIAVHAVNDFQHYPWMMTLARLTPPALAKTISPPSGAMIDMAQFAADSVTRWRSRSEAERKDTKYPVILNRLETLTHREMVAENLDFLVAGADTTACSLTVTFLEVVTHPEIRDKLVGELDAAMQNADILLPVQQLEKLPHLSACIKEGLRFTSAVPSRLPRVVPDNKSDPFLVDGQTVPPGTIVSISAYTMHNSYDIWGPDARSFNPDRWLRPDAQSLEQYLCPFSKGARMCIGQNLVPVEMALTLASLFRKYEMGLPEGFVPPRRVDCFTLELEGGLPLKFRRR